MVGRGIFVCSVSIIVADLKQIISDWTETKEN